MILSEQIPHVGIEDLKRAYAFAVERLDDDSFRCQMEIGEQETWPVVLVGYVVHSLNRSSDEIRNLPYQAKRSDEFFPRQEDES